MSKRYTITAALPYTNGPIHIGHLAGVYIPADIYSRYLRSQGHDVAFICGSDEHGVAISLKAKKEGKTPQEIIDHYDALIRSSFEAFGISFDNYSRTSRAIHHKTAQEIFQVLHEKGVFEEKTTAQLYDPEAKQFLADRFVIGTCPICQNQEAYGDQCESCGSSLNATELINPQSTLSGAKPEYKETKHWYLPLDRYSEFITKWILEGHKNDWKPNVYGQVKSWVDSGLQPRAVTRDLDWGIPVPLIDATGKVLYVWFDAPIGYISSTKEWAEKIGKDWKPYWCDSETQLIHFIGKDNIVFHCIIFPVMLHATGQYILPENVPANEFLNLEGQKISTSKNWAVWLHEYLEAFPQQQDVLRYVLIANAPETKDNDFTWEEFQARNNNELVAIFGNFVNRVFVLTHKYFEGRVPDLKTLYPEDNLTLASLQTIPIQYSESVEKFRFREASQHLIQLARVGNKYLADTEPWKLIKTDPDRVSTILNTALQLTTALSILSTHILPFTSEKLQKMLRLNSKIDLWNSLISGKELLSPNHQIEMASLLFEKIDDAQMDFQREKLKNTEKGEASISLSIAPEKPNIDPKVFNELQLKVGQIIAAEKVPKTKKLMKLSLEVGQEVHSVVSGIAEDYEPELLIGKKVTWLSNLASRTLKGVESKGMILLGENEEGKLVFVSPEDSNTHTGLDIN